MGIVKYRGQLKNFRGVRHFSKGVRDFETSDFICDFVISLYFILLCCLFLEPGFVLEDNLNHLKVMPFLDMGVFPRYFLLHRNSYVIIIQKKMSVVVLCLLTEKYGILQAMFFKFVIFDCI